MPGIVSETFLLPVLFSHFALRSRNSYLLIHYLRGQETPFLHSPSSLSFHSRPLHLHTLGNDFFQLLPCEVLTLL